jgi:hypothetical protein
MTLFLCALWVSLEAFYFHHFPFNIFQFAAVNTGYMSTELSEI